MKNEERREATPAQMALMAHRLDVSAELDAMRTAFEALHKLDDAAKRRAMGWLQQSVWTTGLLNGDEEPF